jgi:nucleoside-diphosphate-sugar epimerase
MKYFVAGGTGVIGRRTVRLLADAGHDVTVLSRSADNDRTIADLGSRPVRADLFDADDLVVATAGHDAVINLATSIPSMRRAARQSAWVTNDRIRTDGVDILVSAARANGIDRYVQESITFTYVDGADRWIDEDHPRTISGVGQAVAHAERRVGEFCRVGGRGVVLRFGQFYDVESDHTDSQAAMVRRRIDPFVGDPDGYLPLIGVPAAARAVVAALSLEAGVYNVVDDDPPTRRETAEAIGRRLGIRPPRRLPASIIRRVNPASDIMMRSQRVSNEALRSATGWQPDHAGADGLATTIAEIR